MTVIEVSSELLPFQSSAGDGCFYVIVGNLQGYFAGLPHWGPQFPSGYWLEAALSSLPGETVMGELTVVETGFIRVIGGEGWRGRGYEQSQSRL